MPTNSLPVLVSDYDLKEYVKTSFSKDQLLLFRAYSRVILGRSQSRNQGKVLWENQLTLAKLFRKYNQKNKRLNVFWT